MAESNAVCLPSPMEGKTERLFCLEYVKGTTSARTI